MLQNYQSIMGKVDKFQADIKTYDPDVILGNETWLDETVQDSQIFPSGYIIYRKDRNRHGGGVFIAVKAKHKSYWADFNLQTEQLWVILELPSGKKLHIGTAYRPPQAGAQTMEEIKQVLENLKIAKNPRKFLLLGGDLNLPSIQWKTNQIRHQPAYGKTLNERAIEIFTENDLTQIVQESTRIVNGHESLLDLILTNHPQQCEDVIVSDDISDHKTVIADFSFNERKTQLPKVKKTVYLYSRANIEEIRQRMEHELQKFKNEVIDKTTNDLWEKFVAICQDLHSNNIPQKTFIVNGKDPPWYNDYLKRMTKKCQKAHKKRNIRNANSTKYRNLRRELKWKLFEAEDRFLRSLSTDDTQNSKRLWSYIKYKHSHMTRTGIQYIQNEKKELVSESKLKATILNNYFGSVFVGNKPLPENYEGVVHETEMQHDAPEITSAGIVGIIKSLKTEAAPGPDQLGPKFFKMAPDIIAEFLKVIFTSSLQTGVLPQQWKQAWVVPIHKTGDKTSANNYRPISLTCTACKILEHIVTSNIAKYLEDNKMFNPSQHGFRKRLSCETQVNSIYHKLISSRDKGQKTDLVFLDYQKAFDKVPHNLLIKKLMDLQIQHPICKWIKEYLTDRVQRVVLEGITSEEINVSSGVPQGSVLGPLLFIIYINDISKNLQSNIGMYADDCVIYRVIQSPHDEEILQEDLNRIVDWAQNWHLPLNIAKCKCMRTKSGTVQENEVYYHINNQALEQVKIFKYLGIQICEDLRWNEHIEFTINKANKMLGFLKHTMYKTTKAVKITTYKTLIRPVLEYGAVVWDPHQLYLQDKLEAVQRKSIRFVCNNYQQLESVTAMRTMLVWPTLAERRHVFRLTMLYKLVTGAVDFELSSYITRHPFIMPRNHKYKLLNLGGSRNLDMYHQSFLPKTIRSWNDLPKSLLDSDIASPKVFQHKVEILFGMTTEANIATNDQ
jgi:Reverse transcriptase (RNA-dependent DNA polymerase)/Endonuclease-reverse transcriptase